MNELKEHIQSISEVLKGECAKIAFWKGNKHWYSYIFELTKNDVLTEFDKKFLENIQKDDPNAVIVDSDDFIEANGDGSILIDDMVISVLLLYSKGQANISDFLEKYAEKNSNIEQQNVMTTQEIVKIMEKQLKKLANWEISETSNGTSISAEMLEIAKFLIEVKKQGLGCE